MDKFSGSYRGSGYPASVIQDAKRLLAWQKLYPRNVNLSYSAIARELGVQSHNTIRNWDNMNMDDWSRMQRRKGKGHNRKISPNDELVIAGYVLDASNNHVPTRTWEVREFILKNYCVHVSPSWVTRFQDRQHLSNVIPSNMLKYEYASPFKVLVDYLVNLRKELQGLHPNQVCLFLLNAVDHLIHALDNGHG